MRPRRKSPESEDSRFDFSLVLLIALAVVIVAVLTWDVWMPHFYKHVRLFQRETWLRA